MTYKVGDYVYVSNIPGTTTASTFSRCVIIENGRGTDRDGAFVCPVNEEGLSAGGYIFVKYKDMTPAVYLSNNSGAVITTEEVLSFEPAPMTEQCTDYADRKNDGKPQLTLLPFDCLAECAKVMMQAKAKYPDQANGKANWEKLWGKDTPKVTLDSALRHITARLSGEVRDKESGQLHAAHAVVNLLFLIRYELEEATK